MSWPVDIRKKLRNLTLSNGVSGMRIAVERGLNPLSCVAFDGNIITGWSIYVHIHPFVFKRNIIMVYVRKTYRRQGIGSSLVKRLKTKVFNDCIGIGWDKRSADFFNSIAKTTLKFYCYK